MTTCSIDAVWVTPHGRLNPEDPHPLGDHWKLTKTDRLWVAANPKAILGLTDPREIAKRVQGILTEQIAVSESVFEILLLSSVSGSRIANHVALYGAI